MDLKTRLEKLRGEEIAIYPLQSYEIPCMETSDPMQLCKNPVVSVQMMTYNHEGFIAQAIDSVLMQKTDFDFELLIGDDCSTDGTLEICLQYQKKYPEKIRILRSDKNLYSINGNELRLRARSRGEFIALCEGDDFWLDPSKLQKQVDVMRQHPNVSICAGDVKWYYQSEKRFSQGGFIRKNWKMGVTPQEEAFAEHHWLATATLLYRRSVFEKAVKEFDIFTWRLTLSDVLVWTAPMYFGDLYVTYDILAAYRSHSGGVSKIIRNKIWRDSGIIQIYFALKTGKRSAESLYDAVRQVIVTRCYIVMEKKWRERVRGIREIMAEPFARSVILSECGIVAVFLMRLGVPVQEYMRYRHGIVKRLARMLFGKTS